MRHDTKRLERIAPDKEPQALAARRVVARIAERLVSKSRLVPIWNQLVARIRVENVRESALPEWLCGKSCAR